MVHSCSGELLASPRHRELLEVKNLGGILAGGKLYL